MVKTKQRYSNLELYRIIIMILIVAHHYVVNSGLIVTMEQTPTSIKSIYLYIFGMWGKTGINCFILITGYFMCQSKITLRKFTKLVLWILFYRIVIYLIFCAFGYINYSTIILLQKLLIINNISDGFTSCFIVFFLTIPFLNILIKNMNKSQHLLLLALSLFIYTFWAQIPYYEVRMNYVIWFDILYLISSYIRIYGVFDQITYKQWGFLTLISIVISVISVLLLLYTSRASIVYYFVSDSNAILAVIVSVCAFMFFKNMPLNYNKWINAIGGSTFGVLLIHANSDTMRQWLWKDTLNNVGHYSDNIFIHSIVSVLSIFIICTIIDLLRIRYIEKPLFIILDNYMAKKGSILGFSWT